MAERMLVDGTRRRLSLAGALALVGWSCVACSTAPAVVPSAAPPRTASATVPPPSVEAPNVEALALSAEELARLDATVRNPPPAQIRALTPYVSSDAFAYVLPPVEALRSRLETIERAAQTRGLPVHH